jgi:carbonic anhydrase
MSIKKSACFFVFLCTLLCKVCAFASENPSSPRNFLQEMRSMVKNILVDNQRFRDDPVHNDEFYKKQASGQHPRATVVACADSRVHTSNFDFHPLGDVFFIRNIGNQLETCLGSVDYGVRHNQTPLLLFLGHSKCGAITAVTEGTQRLEESICKELEPIHITHRTANPTDEQVAENITENVRHQVYKAYERYQDLVHDGKLWIVGAVYDFTPQGRGELKIIQLNNKSDNASIEAFLADAMEFGDDKDPGDLRSEQQ